MRPAAPDGGAEGAAAGQGGRSNTRLQSRSAHEHDRRRWRAGVVRRETSGNDGRHKGSSHVDAVQYPQCRVWHRSEMERWDDVSAVGSGWKAFDNTTQPGINPIMQCLQGLIPHSVRSRCRSTSSSLSCSQRCCNRATDSISQYAPPHRVRLRAGVMKSARVAPLGCRSTACRSLFGRRPCDGRSAPSPLPLPAPPCRCEIQRERSLRTFCRWRVQRASAR